MNNNPTIKEAQNAILEIMKEYDRVCRENNIKYSLHGGTMLGAVRDGGFIPWDDDADVTMMRKEYEKLLNCFNSKSKDFELVESYLHMPRIVRKNYKDDSVFAWLDIMIYDPITENSFGRKIKFLMILFFQAMCRNKVTIKLMEGKNHGCLQMFMFKFAYLLGKPFSYDTKYRWYNNFCKKRLCGKGTIIHRSNDQMKGMKMLVPAECMTQYTDIKYEDTNLMITKDYDKVLTISYGPGYMTPVHDQANDEMHVHFRNAFMQHLNLK